MDQLKKIEFRKARDFGSIINDTFAFLRQNIRILFRALIIIAGIVIMAQGVLTGLYNADTFNMTINKTTENPLANIISLKYLFIIIFGLVSYTFIILIIYEFIVLYLKKESGTVTFDDIWAESKKDFWMIFVTNMASFFVVLFSMLLLIVPGIYFAIVVSLVPLIRIQERTGYFDSLKRSMRLLKGNWWFTCGLLMILMIIMAAMGWVLSIPTTIIYFFAIFHKADVMSYFYRVLFIVSGMLQQFSSLFSVIMLVGLAFQYFNLVEKKEGAGLLKKIDDIGKNDAV